MSKILFANEANYAKNLSSLSRQGKLRRIHQGIYTDDLHRDLTEIVQQNWMVIVAYIVREGILSYRTAVDLKPTPFNGQVIVFLISSYTKTIQLPGLVIKIIKGNSKEHTEQVLPNLARGNKTRVLLENLSTVRGTDYKGIKTIGREGVEKLLAKELLLRGEHRLNEIRDEAKCIANDLMYLTEYKKLNHLISALLSSHSGANLLATDYAKAIVKKEPYDSLRLTLFEKFTLYLKNSQFINRSYIYAKTSFKNLSFYESYFSNFIEGTEFIIDEAEDIVFQGIEVSHRHADSHDILANFSLTNDYMEMTITPKTSAELLELLQNRHAYLMKERPDKRPGEFKNKPNKAGNTYFVAPKDVIGTLGAGFELYKILRDGMEKALFMQFLITEIHPFDDGNGRLSRIMMNAELVKASLYKIIIPSAHRDNYMNGLRLATRDGDFRTYCRAMDQAQAYTASINWLDYGEARTKIEADCANLTPDEGLPILNRQLRQLVLAEFPV